MSTPFKMKLVLQTEPPGELEKNVSHEFEYPDNSIFPLRGPIDLIDFERNAVARIKIDYFTNFAPKSSEGKGHTTGKYTILKVYVGEEKESLTRYWKENVLEYE